ncbi:hypothetical protein ACJX0J_033359 [Zea mays]
MKYCNKNRKIKENNNNNQVQKCELIKPLSKVHESRNNVQHLTNIDEGPRKYTLVNYVPFTVHEHSTESESMLMATQKISYNELARISSGEYSSAEYDTVNE